MSLQPPSLDSFDTHLPADSLEFCPIQPHQDILVVGTYKLDATAQDSASQTRLGKCWLFLTEESGKLWVYYIAILRVKFKPKSRNDIQQFDLPAILDLKWQYHF